MKTRTYTAYIAIVVSMMVLILIAFNALKKQEPIGLHQMLEPVQAEAHLRGENCTAAAICFVQMAIVADRSEELADVLAEWAKTIYPQQPRKETP